eukprot:TRINITY_DN9924_c0_g1_i2.p1 TRINITY_DN9924_c0_g1~~TRINITY_DN9924_c0_g1_i2.p1  ORF type:complete len:127 (+),score=31.44 TRINITY_DN9924_c0_g1_i2:157-537(+)
MCIRDSTSTCVSTMLMHLEHSAVPSHSTQQCEFAGLLWLGGGSVLVEPCAVLLLLLLQDPVHRSRLLQHPAQLLLAALLLRLQQHQQLMHCRQRGCPLLARGALLLCELRAQLHHSLHLVSTHSSS